MCLVASTHYGFAQPNIVFILADDCTKWDIACYGSPDAITPTIDSLALSGMTFSRCSQQAPMCSPTRHSIYTGLYPVRSGAYPNHTFVYPEVQSVVQYLEPLGYRVGLSGKVHVSPASIFSFEYLDDKANPIGSKTEAFVESAKQNKESFCLFVCSNEPHSPWDRGNVDLFDVDSITLPPYLADTEATRAEFRKYLAEIHFLDGQVKETLDLIEKYDLTDNTVVMFASEQGNSFPFAKWTCYNAGLSSALIVRWPGVVDAGTTSDAIVEYVDVLPTIIDIAGGQPAAGLDGHSILPILKKEKTVHKSYTYGLHTTRGINNGSEYYPVRSVADDTFRLILNLTPNMDFVNATTSKSWFKEWKTSPVPFHQELANRYHQRPAIELFNEVEDPYNMNNLADNPAYQNEIVRLKAKLQAWMDYCGDRGIETELRSEERMNREETQQRILVDTSMHAPLPSGNAEVLHDGYYSFYTTADCKLFVDSVQIIAPIENTSRPQRTGVIGLKAGLHLVEIEDAEQSIPLYWSGPMHNKQALILQDIGSGSSNGMSSTGKAFSISPNPVSDYITIETKDSESLMSYRTIDSKGAIIDTGYIRNREAIDVSAFASGLYFFIVNDHESHRTLSFVKQ